MSANITTVFQPTVTITVSDQELASLLAQNLVLTVNGGPPIVRPVLPPELQAELNRQVALATDPSGLLGQALLASLSSQVTPIIDSRIGAVAGDVDSTFGVVNSATIASQSTNLLVSKSITSLPSNGFASTNPQAAFASVPGMTFDVVAPSSGKIIVHMSFGYTLPQGLSTLEVNLRLSSNQDVPNTVRRVRRVTDAGAAGEQNQYVYTMSLSGLTAGQTYSYVMGARNPETGTTGQSVSIQADTGSVWGPAIIEALAIPADPISPTAIYNRFDTTRLSKWVAARAAVAAGTADAKVLVIGDSTAFGYPKGGLQQSWSHKLAQRLVTRGLQAQDGGTTPGLASGDNPRYTAGAGWPSGILYGFGTQGWQYNNPSGVLKYADPYINADRFDVYYVRGSGATSITLQVDSEAAVTSDTTGTVSIGKLTISAAAASTSHSLSISAVGTGAILFVEPWLSTSKRIRVANAGAPSTNSTTWANGIGIYSAAMIAAYQPSVVICLLGANDAVGGFTAKQVVTNLNVLASAATGAGADFIDLSSIPCQILSEASLQQSYAIRTRYATSYAFMDLNKEAGTWTNWSNLGYMSDLRHPNEAGMEKIATMVDIGLALV